MSYWPVVKKVVRDADIVLFILDARMPEISMNEELQTMIEKYGKDLLYVFNKADLLDKDHYFELKRKYPEALLVSGVKNLGMSNLKKKIQILAARKKLKDPQIGVVGYPNVGKSAIINALAHSAKARVSSIAGTTRNIQWIRAGSLRILDSPGVIPMEDKESKLGLLSAKNPDKLRNPEKVAMEIIAHFLKENKRALEKFYDILIDNEEDLYGIIMEIGKKRKLLVKGGEVDENRTYRQIITDWHKGRLKI